MKRFAIGGVALAALAVMAWMVFQRIDAEPPEGTLNGNIEIRRVDVALNSAGALMTMPKREGDTVKLNEVIATLDDAT